MSGADDDLASAEAASHAAGAGLIRDAFALARRSGADNWDRMTTAVLKNRILSLTNRSFNEADWGATSFRDFVGQFPELVDVDLSVRPAHVVLRDRSVVDDASVDDPLKRIRNDLWTAVLDFSSGAEYVWRDGQAVLVSPDDVAEGAAGERLPTITPDQLDNWRSEFVSEAASSGLSPRALEALRLWQAERRPDWTLPRFVRRRWNARLKRFVLDTLVGWFETHGHTPPDDLVDIAPVRNGTSRSERRDETDQLRDVVLRLVRVMNREELEELRLPAAAYLRLRS